MKPGWTADDEAPEDESDDGARNIDCTDEGLDWGDDADRAWDELKDERAGA